MSDVSQPLTKRLQCVVYRAHNPKWAYAPTSGAGAARHGGRFNPPRIEALYTSTSYKTAFTEAQQGLPLKMQPLTIVSYVVDHASILDLSLSEARESADVDYATLACAWFRIKEAAGVPPSWSLANRLIKQGVGGIIVPSFADGASPDATNVVFWRWGEGAPCQVRVVDDEDRLPADQRSWS